MQKREAPLSLAACAAAMHFVERQQGFALGFGVVACGLRAIAAILGTAAGLDGEQRRALNLVGVEVLAVHLLRTEDQIHQGKLVERFDFGDRPAGCAGWQRLSSRVSAAA
jgi:hypothetical protein